MIVAVVFHNQIPFSFQGHERVFQTLAGWSILEIEPGRIQLSHPQFTPGQDIIVDGAAYSLVTKLGQPPVEIVPDEPIPPTVPSVRPPKQPDPSTDVRRKKR